MAARGSDDAKHEYFPLFDYARLALAMTVAMAHSHLFPANYLGDLSVRVFFALSGWLIGGILYDSASKDIVRFYFNRVARIWIPYFFAVALLFGVSLLKEPADLHFFEYLFYDATFTHNLFIVPRIAEIFSDLPLGGTNNHFWTLSVEEQFYLFAPVIIILMRGGRSPLFWAAVALVAWASGQFASIAFGVLAVVVRRRYGDWHLRLPSQAGLFIGLIASWAVIHFELAPYRFASPVFSICLVLLLARKGPASRIGAFAGGISYPLYLNHWVGIFAANELLQAIPSIGFVGQQLVSAFGNLGLASVLYVAIDLQVKKRRSQFYTPAFGRICTMLAFGSIAVGIIGGLVIMALRASAA